MKKLLVLFLLPLAAFGQGAVRRVDTLAQLLSLPVNAVSTSGKVTYEVGGYATLGDGGGGVFYWDPGSTATTNLGLVFKLSSSANGRWFRQDWDGDVRAFGARGDGSTDDASAVQAAVNAGNKVILAPGLQYKIVGPLFLTNSNFTLDGNGATLILDDDEGDASLRTVPLGGIETWAESTALTATNVTIRNLTVKAGDLSTGKNIILFHGVNGGLLENLSIYGNGTNESWALSIDGWNIRAENIFVDNRGEIFQDGIHVFGGTNIVINNSIVLAGDDAFPVGSDNNRRIADVAINNCYGATTHGFPIKIYTATYGPTNQPASSPVERIIISDFVGASGVERNGGPAIFDYSFKGYYTNLTSEVPPRLIRDVALNNILINSPVPPGGSKTVEAPDLYIIGGERITIDGYHNPSPWNQTLLVAVKDIKFLNSHFGAPVRTNLATVQWLSTANGVVCYNSNIEFENCRFDLRGDLSLFNLAPYYTTNFIVRNSEFHLRDANGVSAIYLGAITENADISHNRFYGTSTNGAIYFGGATGNLSLRDNYFDSGWTTYRGSKPTNAWWTTTTGREWRTVGTTDFQVTTSGAQISRATTPSTPPSGALQLEVESLENTLVMRRASGVSGNFHLAGGRLNLNATGGQLSLSDNYTTLTDKVGAYLGTHHNTAEEPIGLIRSVAQTNVSRVQIGGGDGYGGSAVNAATGVDFFGASNYTTAGGTRLASIELGALTSGTALHLKDLSTSSLPTQVKLTTDSSKTLYLGSTPPALGGGTISVDETEVTNPNFGRGAGQDQNEVDFSAIGSEVYATLVSGNYTLDRLSYGLSGTFVGVGDRGGGSHAHEDLEIVAGTGISITWPSATQMSIAATGGGGGGTNGTTVTVDGGADLLSANFIDSTTINPSTSGGNVQWDVIADSLELSHLSASAESYLLDRANHTGTQLASTISDFDNAVWTFMSNSLTASNNISFGYDYGNLKLMISAAAAAGATNSFSVNGAQVIGPNITNKPNASLWSVSGSNITVALPDRDFGDLTVASGGTTMTIDNSAVTTAKIQDSAVASNKIAAGQITTDKLADLTVSTAKIADSAITSLKIANDTIISNDIASATITPNKLVNSGVTPGSYTSANITVNDQGLITAASSGSGSGYVIKSATAVDNRNTDAENDLVDIDLPAGTLGTNGDEFRLEIPARFINYQSGGTNGYTWRLYLDGEVTPVLTGVLDDKFGLSSSYRATKWIITFKRLTSTTLAVDVYHYVGATTNSDTVDFVEQALFDESVTITGFSSDLNIRVSCQNTIAHATLGHETWGYTGREF